MDNEDVRRFRRKLEADRTEAIGSLTRLGSEARKLDEDSPQDHVDRSVTYFARESLFEQGNQLWTTVKMIDEALRRVRNCTFGICVSCGDDIRLARLEAIPWTQYCRRCQERLEQDGQYKSLLSARPVGSVWKRAG
jgi:DnaK suppressor protein